MPQGQRPHSRVHDTGLRHGLTTRVHDTGNAECSPQSVIERLRCDVVTDLRTASAHEHRGDPFTQRVREYACTRPLQRIHVLEAGCGWGPGLDLCALGDVERHVTGVDLDLPALRA